MFELAEKLNTLPLDEFTTEIFRMISESQSCFEDEALSETLEYFSRGTGVEYNFMLYAMSEAEIKKAVKNGAQGAVISELLEECVIAERKFYELLYKPESFEGDRIKWLPGECQYNDILVQFILSGKQKKYLLVEAAKLRPDMAQVLKCWTGAEA